MVAFAVDKDFRVKNGLAVVSTATILSIAISNSTSTGALQVAGGVGIGGKLYVGGLANNTSSYVVYYNVSTGELGYGTAGGGGGIGSPYSGIFTITNTTAASSTTTGALQVAGGVGIGGGLFVGGTVTSTNIIVTGTTNSTSTTTGALQVAGGVGIGGGMYVGSDINIPIASGNLIFGNSSLGSVGSPSIVLGRASTGDTNIISANPGILYDGVNTGLKIFANSSRTIDLVTYDGGWGVTGQGIGLRVKPNRDVQLFGTSASTSTTTGALTVVGGVGIGGGLFVGGISTVTNTTTATNTTTGALQVRGGIGVADSVYVGNRVGFVGTTRASVVYQYYNTLTNSLDTVFG